jgi:hypothetical protein
MAQVALGNVAELLQEQANLHQVLTIPEGDAKGAGASGTACLQRSAINKVWLVLQNKVGLVQPASSARPNGSADITTTPALGLET